MKAANNEHPAEKPKNTLFAVVDKAPFAGKFLIKDVYVGFDTAPDASKTRRAIGAAALMSFMVAAHAQQGYLGAEALVVHAQDAVDGDAWSAAKAGFDALYVGGMWAVAARQAALTSRVASKYITWRKEKNKIPEEDRRKEKRPYSHKPLAMLGAVAFTLSAQFGAMYSMDDARQAEHHNATISIEEPDQH